MNVRNGKIARLPHDARDELKERLERSEPIPHLLDWFNGPREVKKEVFGGGQLGRKPAKYIIQVENDVPGTALALPTTKKEKSRSNQPKRSRQSNQPEKPALKMSNKLKSNNIGKKRSQKPLKPSQAQSK